MYHIIVRSISEIELYKNSDDKVKYMKLLKECKEIFRFQVYAYCLMDNHAHFMIDCCGADISAIMHRINFQYSMYFNHKYNRHGHLFQDRFKSKLVEGNGNLYALSLYIHRNPTDIKKYKDEPEKYRFSSLGVYLKNKTDEFGILDEDYILSLISDNKNVSIKHYRTLMFGNEDNSIIADEMEGIKSLYISGRKIINRKYSFNNIMQFICDRFSVNQELFNVKFCRKMVKVRSLAIVMAKCLCNLKNAEIAKVVGNITTSRISMLGSLGMDLILSEAAYHNIIEDFLEVN
ncbi:MAG: transposase [Clostridiaceae bacterium]